MPYRAGYDTGSPSAGSLGDDGNRDEEPDFQLREILQTVLRRKFLVFSLTVAGVVAAIIFVALSPKMYSSTATIEVNKQDGASIGLNDLSGIASGLGGGAEVNTELLTQAAVIQSDNVALGVIGQLNLTSVPAYSVPTKQLTEKSPLTREQGLPLDQAPHRRERIVQLFNSRLKVTLVKDTRLLTITYTDTDATRAADIANAVVDAYTREYTQARYNASTRASTWLSDQLTDLKNKVLESQRKVSEYQEKTGLVGTGTGSTATNPGAQTDSVTMNRFVDLNRDLTNAEVDRIAKEAIYRMTDTTDPDTVLGIASSQLASSAGPGSVLASGGAEIGLLSSLQKERSQLQVQLAADTNSYGSKNPRIVQLQSEIKEVDAQIQKELTHIHERARSDFELATRTENGLRDRVSAQQQEVTKLSTGANQLLLLQQEEISNRLLYQDLYTKLEEANVAAGIKASNITIVDPARVSTVPSLPKVKTDVASGFAFGLILGLFLAFLLDFMDDTLNSPEQTERISHLPLLGVIPQASSRRSTVYSRLTNAEAETAATNGSTSWLISSPNSAISEAFRSLRSSILLSQARLAPKLLLFTSPMSGDGKTTICFNTAVSFALQGGRVLLIDADMRRPRLHAAADVPNGIGLSQYLSSDIALADVVRPYPHLNNLSIITCGALPPMPSELLGSGRFLELLNQVSKDYDFVLIDSPPLLLVTDAIVISRHVDNTMIIVRYKKTTVAMLKRIIAKFAGIADPRIRLVLNGMDWRTSSYGYYNGGYAYYAKDE